MAVSKYHLIKFLIRTAEATSQTEEEWKMWFDEVSRVYKRKMPSSVLMGLKRVSKSNSLTTLCDAELAKQTDNHDDQEYIQEHKRQKWIERRDAGNARAKLEREQKRAEVLEKAKIVEKYAEEKFVEAMTPVWAAQLDDYIAKREQLVNSL